jgi:hypothetical protein
MQSLKRMIDTAAVLCSGGKAGLARRLNVTPQKVSDWRAGRVSCPYGQFVAIAAIAGERDPLAAYGAYRAQREQRRASFALASVAGLACAVCVAGAALLAPSTANATARAIPLGDTSHIIRKLTALIWGRRQASTGYA